MTSLSFSRPTAAASAAHRSIAIDLVHLSRHTFGERSLEIELLRLFDAQLSMAEIKLSTFTDAIDSADVTASRELAHLLTGSARAVGALEIAAAAETWEQALVACDRADIAESRGFLLGRIGAARSDIADLLA